MPSQCYSLYPCHQPGPRERHFKNITRQLNSMYPCHQPDPRERLFKNTTTCLIHLPQNMKLKQHNFPLLIFLSSRTKVSKSNIALGGCSPQAATSHFLLTVNKITVFCTLNCNFVVTDSVPYCDYFLSHCLLHLL